MGSNIEDFCNRTEQITDFLYTKRFTVRHWKGLMDSLNLVSDGRSTPFDWSAKHVPAGDGVREHVAIHLCATQSEDSDFERRRVLEANLQNVLGAHANLFCILLHYKD